MGVVFSLQISVLYKQLREVRDDMPVLLVGVIG